nr:bifunctional demethylmenaquinone methyltransferase/2-methoxy-6-polyprenyl-1,4-benzoquinol methylase UbiE [Haematospirillum jordaniae]
MMHKNTGPAADTACVTDEAPSARTTHFGFRTVREDEKEGLVRGVFTSVARRYDLMNDVMSLGVHRLWKDRFVDMLAPRAGMQVLDVGGGTGDIAFRILDRVRRRVPDLGGTTVQVCDINTGMLNVGRDRALDRGHPAGLTWINGDAESLPFPDASFDAYTIAFCLRNVTRIDQALKEARRVLKPGGRFLCLEFSKVLVPGLDRLYDLYSFAVLPRMGQLVAGDRDSYRYLAESIRQFPAQKELADRMVQAGLSRVAVHNLSGGIAAIHSAWRI